MKPLKIIELTQSPSWPREMICPQCRFPGYLWLGMTREAFQFFSKTMPIAKCNKCGVGILGAEDGKLPFFIFKKI